MMVEVTLQLISTLWAKVTHLGVKESTQRVGTIRVKTADCRERVGGDAFVVLYWHHM